MARAQGSARPARVGERIREELMRLFLRGAVKDPAVQGAVVHAVKVSPDLSIARVYVRHLSPSVDRAQLLRGLERATGFLRRELGPVLRTRRTPALTFFWDDTPERAARVEALLDEVRPTPDEE